MAAAVLCLVLAACNTTRHSVPPAPSNKLIEAVPFYPDASYQCGPATLAGVLNFWGVRVSQEEIADAVFSKSAGGALGMDLAWYARSRGMQAKEFEGTLADVRRAIDQGRPLIVFVDLGFGEVSAGHFMVVIGYTDDGIIANSGKNRFEIFSNNRFDRLWSRNSRWTLLITQPS